jgi:hypothetical protein
VEENINVSDCNIQDEISNSTFLVKMELTMLVIIYNQKEKLSISATKIV